MSRVNAAIASLRSYQTGYPDYDAVDWLGTVEVMFTTASVRKLAVALAGLADDSLRGIEVTQADLAKSAGITQSAVSKAIIRLANAGLVKVAKRPVKSNGVEGEFYRHPDAYQLVIPDAPTWDLNGSLSPYSVIPSCSPSVDDPQLEHNGFREWLDAPALEYPDDPVNEYRDAGGVRYYLTPREARILDPGTLAFVGSLGRTLAMVEEIPWGYPSSDERESL